jgi:hypothetical protein
MSQTLVLPDDVYEKVTQSAAKRGLTVEAWLKLVSEAAQRSPTAQRDRQRGRDIERLLDKCRAEKATDDDRAELDRLIDEEYRAAVGRADARIAAKRASAGAPRKPSRRSSRTRSASRLQ